jgi:hypothetical protein
MTQALILIRQYLIAVVDFVITFAFELIKK